MMKRFTREHLDSLDYIFKINLVNSLSGYKSANLIGSISLESIENVAVFSSVVHLGSTPPLFGFILRPTTVPRNTYENIKNTGYFTINHVSKSMIEDAHHTSAKYSSLISEFEVTDLTCEYLDDFIAPFVAESPVKIAMKYVEELLIPYNQTKMIIGEVQFLEVKKEMMQSDGFLNLSRGEVATINGLDGYAVPKLFKRLAYQRPKECI